MNTCTYIFHPGAYQQHASTTEKTCKANAHLHTIPGQARPCRTLPYRSAPCRTIPDQRKFYIQCTPTLPYPTLPFRTVPYHAMPYHAYLRTYVPTYIRTYIHNYLSIHTFTHTCVCTNAVILSDPIHMFFLSWITIIFTQLHTPTWSTCVSTYPNKKFNSPANLF